MLKLSYFKESGDILETEVDVSEDFIAIVKAIRDYAQQNEGQFPSQGIVAENLSERHLSKKDVSKILNEYRKLGLIDWERGSTFGSNEYFFPPIMITKPHFSRATFADFLKKI
ncbi:hypothetical protein FAI40_02980 [Acetobacteraceae bacterium]|nr:hypothetical protein FAI40_02980 [Acetobacteraceae bacterium]